MKQVTQLQIPFDDYEIVSSEPLKPQAPAAAVSDFIYYSLELPAYDSALRAAAVLKSLIPSLALFALAALFVSFGFSLMFLAAIIGG
ncbi:MAG: hypothetical protein IJ618_06475 [Prevotella sp.]|nr:hypothetical protein [Prevotella sp.]